MDAKELRIGNLVYKDNKSVITDLLSEPYFIVRQLIEWNFDVFGLLEKNEAIDINTINHESR